MRPALAIVALVLVACVNGDDTSGPQAGSLGGPCLTNGTCDKGLECVLENQNGVCEESDATVDATVDQSCADAPAEASSSDAGADAPVEACAAIAQEPCPGKGPCLTGCCASTGFCALSSQCTDNSTPWACVNGAKCDAGLCCVGITIEDAGTCPPVVVSTPSACHTGSVCTPGQNALCTSNTDCPPATPTCKTILVQGMTTPIGVCR